jgi:hypothetical protein
VILYLSFAYLNRNLDESGFIEVVDICFPPKVYGGKLLPDDSYLKKWADLLVKATTSHGCPIDGAKNHKSQLRDAGFVKIVEKTYVWPQNQWPIDKKGKELGIFYLILPRGYSSLTRKKRSVDF